MSVQEQGVHKYIRGALQPLFEDKELLAKVIEFFPYPIQVFTPDGTVRLINRAALETIGIRSIESHVDKYNVFEDPIVRNLGFTDQVRQVLKGKTVHLVDFNTSYQDLIYYHKTIDRDIQTISCDITCFPIFGYSGEIEYFVAVSIIKKIYQGREEITRARQYIENNWNEPFSLSKTARAACLSKAQFLKLFKKHTGTTPHEYYINYKINILKEKLLDTNLSIAQAFSACNMNYNGYYAKLFREKVGVSPAEYRKNSEQRARLV